MPPSLQPPKQKMPGWRAAFSYAFAVVFDALKFIFDIFIFAAPVLAGIAAKIYAETSNLPGFVGNALAFAAGSSVAVAELFVGTAVLAFGVLMAMAVSFFGWLFLSLWFVTASINPFSRRRVFATMLGLGASIVPFLNILPTFTPTVWYIVRSVRREDREARKKWEKERSLYAARLAGLRHQQEAAQLMQENAVAEQVIIQEAEADAMAERMKEKVATQDNEIPEMLRKAT